MGVRDDELDAAQAPAGELAQERRPKGLGLGGAGVEPQHLAPAVAVGAHRDDHSGRDDPAGLADLQVGRVDPQIGPRPLNGPGQKGVHALVDLLTETAHLALGNARGAHGLDQVVH